MTEMPLLTLNRGTLHAFTDALQLALLRREVSATARDLDTLARRFAAQIGDLHELWDDAWRALESDPSLGEEDQGTIGESLRRLFRDAAECAADLKHHCARIASAGYPVAGAATLGPALEKIERLRQALEANWPWPGRPALPIDPTMVAAAREAIARGEPLLDLEDMLGGLPR